MNTALLVTHSGDYYNIDQVTAGLERRGWRGFRFDTDLVPTESRVEAWRSGSGARTVLHTADGALDLATVGAVWRRKLWAARLPPELDPAWVAACRQEAMALVEGALSALDGLRQVNPPGADALGERKLLQLAVAQARGLPIPDTVVTNDPAAIRAFFAKHDHVVTKMQTPFSMSMRGDTPFVYTTRVRADDADAIVDGLGVAPVVLQAEVPKAAELRVAVVGDRCFAGAIHAAVDADGPVDWRHPDAQVHGEWVPGALPPGAEARLCAIARDLGLVYGAADVIITPDGAPVFLEINPSGEWGMLEKYLGLPIGDAIAAELTGVRL